MPINEIIVQSICLRNENVHSDMCAQRRFRSDCAFAQSDPNLHWAHCRQLKMQSVFLRTSKTLIRLRGCEGLFESSLCHVSEGAFSHVTVHIDLNGRKKTLFAQVKSITIQIF